jgi:hypothetical protein
MFRCYLCIRNDVGRWIGEPWLTQFQVLPQKDELLAIKGRQMSDRIITVYRVIPVLLAAGYCKHHLILAKLETAEILNTIDISLDIPFESD